MRVKGTAVKSTRDFIQQKHPAMYQKWLDSLPNDSKTIFTTTLDASSWYPIQEAYKVPMEKTLALCYPHNAFEGADQMGSFSAETALRGVYKVFLLVASPQFLVQRAAKIFTTYFEPSEIEAEHKDARTILFRIKRFESINEHTEYRIAGWIRKALEMANCREVGYVITKSLARGNDSTEIQITWK